VTSTVAIRPDANQRCRTCGARVLWVVTERGNKMPLDADPDPAGRFVLADGDPPLAVYVGEGSAARPGEGRYQSHFASCPDSKKWRGQSRA
jgi:hypothetical protein